LKVSQGNTNIHTKTVAVDFCTHIKVIAKCLAEYQSKACEDTLIFDDTGASQFEQLQLPKDVLTIENNDICCMFTDDACTTNADNQRDYSEMTYSDVSYTRVKTDVQTKSTDAKDKAKTQSVGERARSNQRQGGSCCKEKKKNVDMESRADKMILYGPGMKMEEVAIRTKYLMELRDLEIDVEDIDEME
jgi:hypothetical protein